MTLYYLKLAFRSLFQSKNSRKLEHIAFQLEYYEGQCKHTLYGQDVISRFDELYELLGVERTKPDWSAGHPKLVKISKKRKKPCS